jgi:hypothetical protein
MGELLAPAHLIFLLIPAVILFSYAECSGVWVQSLNRVVCPVTLGAA